MVNQELDKIQRAYIAALVRLMSEAEPATDSNILITMMRNYDRQKLKELANQEFREIYLMEEQDANGSSGI